MDKSVAMRTFPLAGTTVSSALQLINRSRGADIGFRWGNWGHTSTSHIQQTLDFRGLVHGLWGRVFERGDQPAQMPEVVYLGRCRLLMETWFLVSSRVVQRMLSTVKSFDGGGSTRRNLERVGKGILRSSLKP